MHILPSRYDHRHSHPYISMPCGIHSSQSLGLFLYRQAGRSFDHTYVAVVDPICSCLSTPYISELALARRYLYAFGAQLRSVEGRADIESETYRSHEPHRVAVVSFPVIVRTGSKCIPMSRLSKLHTGAASCIVMWKSSASESIPRYACFVRPSQAK